MERARANLLAGPLGLTELQNTFDRRAVLVVLKTQQVHHHCASAGQTAPVEITSDGCRARALKGDAFEKSRGVIVLP